MNRIILFITCTLLAAIGYTQSDGCSAATSISVTANCSSPTSGTTVGATQTIAGCVGTADDDVWYSFVATSSSHNIYVTGNGTFDAVIQLFSGGCAVLNSISCQDQTFGGGTETIFATGLTPGNTYTYRVYDYYSGAPGTFTTCVTTAATPPANDAACSATSLTVNAGCVNTSSTSVAATESMTGCAGNADDDVWFSFVATNSVQTITVDPSANMDPVVQLFEGTCSSMLSLYCEDSGFTDGNEVISAVGLTPGNTYFIRVYDYYTSTGGDPFQICVTGAPTAAPANDEPCNAISLPPVTAACNYLNFTTTGATASLGAPTPTACVGGSGFPAGAIGGFSGTSQDVWFAITVPSTGNIYVTAEPGFGINDAVMALYSGTCGSLTQIACSDDHNYPGGTNDLRPYISQTGLTPGSTVYLRYWGWGSSSGDFGLCVTSPTNDDCANALYICDLNGYSASTSAAYSPDRPGTGAGQMYGNNETPLGVNQLDGINTGGPFGGTTFDVNIENNSWITFTASATTATLTVSIYDCWVGNFPSGGIQMEIFSGTNCDNFVSVSNFEESSTGFVITATGLTIGQDYYLMVDGYAGDICNYTITADSGVAFPEITATANPLCSGETTTLTAPATATSYLWSPGGATTPSIVVSPSSTTTYSCIVEGVCGYKQTLTYTVDVNQLPTFTTASTSSVCSGIALNIPLTSNITSNYSWIATNNTNTTGESLTTQNTNTITNTIINGTTSTQNITYTVTPTAISTGCVGPASTITVAVNPIPAMTSSSSATICNGDALNIPLSSNIASSFTWVATNNPSTTGESTTNQTTSTINNTIANSTSSVQTVNYSVFPTSTVGSCVGSTQSVTVTVNPSPTMTSAASAAICTGATLNLGLTSNMASSYSWVAASNGNVSGESTSAQPGSTINNTLTNATTSPEIVVYTVTPTATLGTCLGTDQTVNVTVNPSPTMTNGTTATICSGATLSIGLSSNVAANYSWIATSNTNITGESLSAQSSNLINNTLINTTATPQTVTYTVTPTSTVGSCTGTPQTITVSVNPSPTMTSSNTAAICSGDALNIALTSDVASSYNWGAVSNPNVTGESTSTQTTSTINNTLTNNTSSVQTVTYNVIAISTVGSCSSSPQTVTVTVNPSPTMTSVTSNTICTGETLNIGLTSNIASSYSWVATSNSNVTGESTSAQTSSTINNTLLNATSSAQTVVYNVTPTSTTGTCLGSTQVVNVTVNPSPTMTSANSATICSGDALAIGLTSNVASSYSWIAASNGNVTGESTSAQSSNTINNTLTNTTSSPETVNYTVTPTSSTGSCLGSDQTVTVTVNPSPSMTSSNSATICSGETLSIALTSDNASSYSWIANANSNVTGESTSAQSSSTINNTLINGTSSAETVTYTVTPTSTLGSCSGTPQTVTVTINPLPTASASNNNPCDGLPLTLTGGSASLSYSWSGPNGFTSTSQNPTVSSTASSAMAGVYILTVTDAGTTCSNTATTTATINSLPTLDISGISLTNPSACAASDGSISGIIGSGAPVLSYSWNGGSSQAGTTNSGLAAGNYSIVVTDGNGCTANAGPFALSDPTPPAAPTITIAAGPICVGGSFTISVTSPDPSATYTWSGPNAYSNTGSSITLTNITTAETGSYDVSTTISGCTVGNATAPVNVTVNTLPLVDVLPPLVVNCNNPTVTLDGSNSEQGASISYSWNASAGGSYLGAGSSDTETTSTPGDYELTVTNATTGCLNSEIVSVTTNTDTPTADITTTNGGQLDCSNTSLILVGTGSTNDAGGTSGISYTWSTTSGGTSIGSGSTQSVSSAGDYYLLVEETASGCTDEQMITITADANVPVAIITNINDLTCDSTSITLIGNTSTGGTFDYNWEDANPTSISTASSVTISTPGTYTLTVTNPANSCTNTATITIAQDITLPIASNVPSATEVDCNNPSITLDGSSSSQGANFDYTWTTAGGNITGTTNTDQTTADGAGSYTLTVENTTTGCTETATTSLTLDTTLPVADAGTGVNFPCGVTDVALDGSGSTGNGITYNWTGPGTITGGTTATPSVSGTGAYTLTVTGSNGCTDTDIVNVIPDSNAPNADAGTAITVTCLNPLPVNLDGTNSDAGATISYNWTTSGTGNIINGTSTTPSVDQAGTYTITVTNSANNCTATSTITVTTDTVSPTADASATQSTVINCTSNLVTTLDGSNSSGTGLTYVWSTSNGTIDSQSGTNAIVGASGDYELEVTGANGCVDITTINITVDTINPSVSISPSDTLNCNLTSLVIDASVSTGVNESYQWTTINGSIISGDNANMVSIGSAGIYTLTITNGNGCASTANTTVSSSANPTADFTPSVLTGTIPLTVDFINNSTGSNLTNAWTFGDGNVSPIENPSNTFIELGTYTVELIVIDEFGCSDTAEVIIDASGDYGITIPNIFTPNSDGSNDIFNVDIEHASEFQATIFNRWGQLIYEWEGTEGGWDGYTYSGVLASEGTYFYLFVVTDIQGTVYEYQGHFRLSR